MSGAIRARDAAARRLAFYSFDQYTVMYGKQNRNKKNKQQTTVFSFLEVKTISTIH